MSVEPLDHTADVGMEIEAASLAGLFAEAAAAFTDLVTDVDAVCPLDTLDVELAADDRELLLVEWLEELVFRLDSETRLFRRAEVEIADLDGRAVLAATLFGEPYDPERHPLKVAVKGVTYHGLEVRRTGGRWRARVIFDI